MFLSVSKILSSKVTAVVYKRTAHQWGSILAHRTALFRALQAQLSVGFSHLIVMVLKFLYFCRWALIFFRTHLFMEPIAVATRRNLPSIHPQLKLPSPLLREHLRTRQIDTRRGGGVWPDDCTLRIGGGGVDVFTYDYTFTTRKSWCLLARCMCLW